MNTYVQVFWVTKVFILGGKMNRSVIVGMHGMCLFSSVGNYQIILFRVAQSFYSPISNE